MGSEAELLAGSCGSSAAQSLLPLGQAFLSAAEAQAGPQSPGERALLLACLLRGRACSHLARQLASRALGPGLAFACQEPKRLC